MERFQAVDTQMLAEVFGTSPRTIRGWLKRGEIPGRKIGRSWYSDPGAVRERLQGRGDRPQPAGTGTEG